MSRGFRLTFLTIQQRNYKSCHFCCSNPFYILLIFLTSSTNDNESPRELPFSELPAIRALITVPALYQYFLSMLFPVHPNLGGSTGSQTTNASMLPSGNPNQEKQGRKRSPSEDSTSLASRKKLLLSPTSTSRLHFKQSSQLYPSGTNALVAGLEGQRGQFSASNYSAFAAAIFYSVLQHVNHWPVQIMKAYAEDSFGPRAWVDDERCKVVVSNLEMSLKPNRCDECFDKTSNYVAEEVENYFCSLISPSEENASSPKQSLSALNKSAMPVQGSPSNNKVLHMKTQLDVASMPTSQQKQVSSKQKRKQMKPAQCSDESGSSSSGEEEVIESESSNILPLNKPQIAPSSPNGMVVDSRMSAVSLSMSQQCSSSTPSPLHIIFQQRYLTKKRVRPRYIGPNLDLAYEAISDALADRLNSKIKQNSRLLQILPSFVSIPRVRCLASRHLERWLQSPALAGLARNLFAQIVRHVRNVDPPLPDDTEAIENILKMNLKANQVSLFYQLMLFGCIVRQLLLCLKSSSS